MESLPIFLDQLVPAWMAIILSTTAVLIFGEVIPQAICTGPSQIEIASMMSPVVKFLIFICFPICWPIGKILDRVLGLHGNPRFGKKDLKALIELHEIKKCDPAHPGHGDTGELTREEIKIITSTIDLRDVTAKMRMIPMDKVFMLDQDKVINQDLLRKIGRRGHSKIPIFSGGDRNKISGILTAKGLMIGQNFLGKTVKDSGLKIEMPLIIAANTNLLE